MQQSMTQTLQNAFEPRVIFVDNESHLHHSGKGVNSHFKITLVSDQFVGQSLIKRHRAVQNQLKPLTQGLVHAVGLHLYTPEEWLARGELEPDSPACAGG